MKNFVIVCGIMIVVAVVSSIIVSRDDIRQYCIDKIMDRIYEINHDQDVAMTDVGPWKVVYQLDRFDFTPTVKVRPNGGNDLPTILFEKRDGGHWFYRVSRATYNGDISDDQAIMQATRAASNAEF